MSKPTRAEAIAEQEQLVFDILNEEFTELVKEIHISTVAIGGIDTLNINNLAISKVDLVASSSGLFEGVISNNYKSLFRRCQQIAS